MKASEVRSAIQKLADPERAKGSQYFFKTGPGQYGEGDLFLGLSVPQMRKIAKQYQDLPLSELGKLLNSKFHEDRLTSLLILVLKYKKAEESDQKKIVKFYLDNLEFVNNWDLVDSSAHYILGNWLLEKDRKVLFKLAKSKVMWERRVAIISTFAFIYAGEHKDTFAIAELLLNDKQDLIQKAVGWMLREVGKRVNEVYLRQFLKEHAKDMPRTALRYAIEKLPEPERKSWLKHGQV